MSNIIESVLSLTIIVIIIRAVVILAAFALLFYFLLLPMIRSKKEINNKRQETMGTPDIYSRVTVFSRTLRNIKAGLDTRTIPFISFEMEDGTRKDFECDMSLYSNTREGDTGFLTYKEKNGFRIIIAFQRQR